MMAIATNPSYGKADLPRRWEEEFAKARSREDQAEILELGKAEIFMKGIMGACETK